MVINGRVTPGPSAISAARRMIFLRAASNQAISLSV